MTRWIAFLTLVCLLLSARPASAAYPSLGAVTWQTAHPRVIFDADSLAVIRARLGISPANPAAPGYAVWVKIQTTANSYKTTMGSDALKWCVVAAAYVLSGDLAYGTPAYNWWVTYCIGAPATDKTKWPQQHNTNEGPLWAHLLPGPLGYDWLFPLLSAGDKSTATTRIANAKIVNLESDLDSGGFFWRVADTRFASLLAIVGDAIGGGAVDAAVADSLNGSVSRWVNRNQACLAQLWPGGQADSYCHRNYSKNLLLHDGTKECSSYDVAAKVDTSSWLQGVGDYALHWHLGAQNGFARYPDKDNPTHERRAPLFAWAGSRMGDRYAQSFANALVGQDEYTVNEALQLAAFWVPTAPATDFRTANREWWDPDGEWYRYNQSFEAPGSPEQPWRFFWWLGPRGYAISAPGCFALSRGLDTGFGHGIFRLSDAGPFEARMYGRAYGKSGGLCIYDPAETFQVVNDCVGTGLERPNDGGTILPITAMWTTKCQKCFKGGAAQLGNIGERKRSWSTSDYWYEVSNLSAAYSAAKASEATQSVLLCKPEDGADGLVVLWYQVTTAKANLQVWVQHWTRYLPSYPPLSNPSWTVVEGIRGLGGIFTNASATRLKYESGTSRFWLIPLVTSGEISPGSITRLVRAVGGPSASGDYLQSYNPGASATYGTDQSYEGRYAHLSPGQAGYGVNYIPGACDPGACPLTCRVCDRALTREIISQQYSLDGGGAIEGFDSCPNQTQLGALGAASGERVSIIYALQATEGTRPPGARPILHWWSGNVCAIAFDDGTKLRCLVLQAPRLSQLAAPGDEQTTVTWVNPFYSANRNYGAQYQALDPGPDISFAVPADELLNPGGGGPPFPGGPAVHTLIQGLKRSVQFRADAWVAGGWVTWHRDYSDTEGRIDLLCPSTVEQLRLVYEP